MPTWVVYELIPYDSLSIREHGVLHLADHEYTNAELVECLPSADTLLKNTVPMLRIN